MIRCCRIACVCLFVISFLGEGVIAQTKSDEVVVGVPKGTNENNRTEEVSSDSGQRDGGQSDRHRPMQPTAAEAIKRLKEGNQRFVECHASHPHEKKEWRVQLESGQHPFAVVLGCSDSRVPPELVFDQGLGDLFVVRVAGNVVDTDVIASIEYAVDHLGTPLVVVMGHTGCGAVTAALDGLKDPGNEPAEVISLLYQIEPATVGLDDRASHQEKIDSTVRRNVELAVRRLSLVPDLRGRIRNKSVEIAGAMYDMHTGKVHFFGNEREKVAAKH
ncbi:MAG: carbonic anhydrase [Planctomycetota bacterium]